MDRSVAVTGRTTAAVEVWQSRGRNARGAKTDSADKDRSGEATSSIVFILQAIPIMAGLTEIRHCTFGAIVIPIVLHIPNLRTLSLMAHDSDALHNNTEGTMTIEQLIYNHDAKIHVGNRELVRQSGYFAVWVRRQGERPKLAMSTEDLKEALRVLTEEK